MDLVEPPAQLRSLSPLISHGDMAAGKSVIELELSAAAYELVRDGVTVKSRKSGVYTVLMPEKLAGRLSAGRGVDEAVSDVILRLAAELKGPSLQHPSR